MKGDPIYIGHSPLYNNAEKVKGEYVSINDELFYKINHFDQMSPFFMSIVSDSDHWLFIWSNGALSAGRKNPDSALFPYYTDDKIRDNADITGSKTLLLIKKEQKTFLWEPFSEKYAGVYRVQKNLYKNIFGNKIVFEEINQDLQLTFQYSWCNSDIFGFVKQSKLFSANDHSITVQVLDGIQNILPYGADQRLQEQYSTLADGYKKNEIDEETGLGIFVMSSIPVDKAEPSEALRSTTVWSCGLEKTQKLLSANQLEKFRKGFPVKNEQDIKATRGAYFVSAEIELAQGLVKEWYIVAEVNQNAADVIKLKKILKSKQNLTELLQNDIALGTETLAKIVANADGLQLTADRLGTSRHYANVLFNVMRGGIFENNYQIRKADLLSFLSEAHSPLLNQHNSFFDSLPEKLDYNELPELANKENDPNLTRLLYEYLPLTFSRRHGDPSRPWNLFSIDIKNDDGSPVLSYQGNWRDIFQNWEALSISFPGYVESMICKFVNASTADGYNPYRITRDGIDWEIHDPADPWSNIGYWGDHQIIYLLKLLEISNKYHPGTLSTFLQSEIFCYANVPYKIKAYQDLLKDPKETIDFDSELENYIDEQVEHYGSDGKLIFAKNKQVYHVNLTEKLLVSILNKFANFIPEAGIWLNTQRPEWNDANNALVGYGVSMVTLYYMRRFQIFCKDLFNKSANNQYQLSAEVFDFLHSLIDIFVTYQKLLTTPISDKDRREIMDKLGEAGSQYRQKIYKNGFSTSKKNVLLSDLNVFFDLSLQYIDHSIKANKRADNLYHSYNLMKIENDGSVSIRYLYEMLEGQVAVLSSGFLSGEESIMLLAALKNSSLYREDQYSYILYPNRTLSRFDEKNNITAEDFNKSKLLQKLAATGNRQIIVQDVEGGTHFNGDMRNAEHLKSALELLKTQGDVEVDKHEIETIIAIYEKIFDHRSFTGRSGTFYKYEGLGCIYWHMVSKLLLAVQETFFNYVAGEHDKVIAGKLIEYYYDIRAGIGLNKTPDNYGAFPTDPYSHTPDHIGAQQPGMTGQVKEDILSRFGELGVEISDGKISFHPILLRKEEFLKEQATFSFFDVNGTAKTIDLKSDSLAFTFAQVPVVYHLSDKERIIVSKTESQQSIAGHALDQNSSESIFKRKGEILQLDVFLKADQKVL